MSSIESWLHRSVSRRAVVKFQGAVVASALSGDLLQQIIKASQEQTQIPDSYFCCLSPWCQTVDLLDGAIIVKYTYPRGLPRKTNYAQCEPKVSIVKEGYKVVSPLKVVPSWRDFEAEGYFSGKVETLAECPVRVLGKAWGMKVLLPDQRIFSIMFGRFYNSNSGEYLIEVDSTARFVDFLNVKPQSPKDMRPIDSIILPVGDIISSSN